MNPQAILTQNKTDSLYYFSQIKKKKERKKQ
jgi:hypothetical protein